MKYYDIMDKEENGIFISFTDEYEAEEWLRKEKRAFPERIQTQGLHIVVNERFTLCERRDKAFAIANNAIYFNDKSDYLKALFEICETLKPSFDIDDIGKKYLEE